MAGIRMTGLASGLDTQSLVGELSKAYQKKVDNSKKVQTKAEWKKNAWSALNTKLTNFYKGSLNTFQQIATYRAKSVTGDLKGVKVTAGNNAVNGTHKVKVLGTASAQMWTGHKINNGSVTATSYTAAETATKLTDLTDSSGNSLLNSLNGAQFEVTSASDSENPMTVNLDLTGLSADATVADLTDYVNNQLSGTGLTVSYTDGKFTFANSIGDNVTIKALNTSAKAFGISDDSGLTVNGNESASGSAFAYKETLTAGSAVTGSTKLSDLGITATSITVNGNSIAIDRNTTLSGLATEMAKQGINASYDSNQGRFYLSGQTTGTSFTVDADSETLKKLGLDYSTDTTGKIDASKASIEYNGVVYESENNTFNINGLTFEATSKGEEMTFTVGTDVDGIYNKVKDFLKEYNSLLKEMNTLYNADSSRGYEPLTSDEKDAMTDDEVKEWEDKIKGSLLRRDDTLSSLISNMRTIMNKSVTVINADGSSKGYTLASFGIGTSDWTEKGLLHIDGDVDDSSTSGNTDKLKVAIAADPEAVAKTLSGLGKELYGYMMKAQAKTTTSSSQTFYNDLTLDSDIKTAKDNVKKMQQKMEDEEDKYYKQFSAMESAMAKLQSQQSYLSGLFGGMSS